MTLLFYKTSPAPTQSPDFSLHSQYIPCSLSHFSEGLPLLSAEKIQTPLDIHTNHFFLPLHTPSGSPFSGFLGWEDSVTEGKAKDFDPDCTGPKLGSVPTAGETRANYWACWTWDPSFVKGGSWGAEFHEVVGKLKGANALKAVGIVFAFSTVHKRRIQTRWTFREWRLWSQTLFRPRY